MIEENKDNIAVLIAENTLEDLELAVKTKKETKNPYQKILWLAIEGLNEGKIEKDKLLEMIEAIEPLPTPI